MEKVIYLHGITPDELKKLLQDSVKGILESDSKKQEINNKSEFERLLSRKEISEYLGITLTTLHKWMNKGLPFKTMNGRRYFLASEVLAAIEKRKTFT